MKESPLVAQAYDYLRQEIITCRLQPNEKLSDNNIAKQLNISRAPVREALLRLQMDGLVQLNEEDRLCVSTINYNDIADILSVRTALESEAIMLIAEKGWLTPEQTEALAQLHERFQSTMGFEHVALNYEIDDQFHHTLVSYSESPRIIEILDRMQLQMQRARWLNIVNPQRHMHAIEEHTALLDAIVAQDVDAAVNCMRLHLMNSRAAFRSILQSKTIQNITNTINAFFLTNNSDL